jgi:hypothetical protein
MPLATQHYLLLQRNLVYAGVTRDKKLVGADWTEKGAGHIRQERPDAATVLRASRVLPWPTGQRQVNVVKDLADEPMAEPCDQLSQ